MLIGATWSSKRDVSFLLRQKQYTASTLLTLFVCDCEWEFDIGFRELRTAVSLASEPDCQYVCEFVRVSVNTLIKRLYKRERERERTTTFTDGVNDLLARTTNCLFARPRRSSTGSTTPTQPPRSQTRRNGVDVLSSVSRETHDSWGIVRPIGLHPGEEIM